MALGWDRAGQIRLDHLLLVELTRHVMLAAPADGFPRLWIAAQSSERGGHSGRSVTTLPEPRARDRLLRIQESDYGRSAGPRLQIGIGKSLYFRCVYQDARALKVVAHVMMGHRAMKVHVRHA